jgi:hypothetical protein
MSFATKMTVAVKYLAPFVALSSLAAPAIAGNVKSYPGTLCQAQGNTSRLNYYEHGAAHNSSTSADMNIVCPIVRDEVRADGTGWASLFVTTLNLSPSVWLSCDARSYHPDDYGFQTVSKRWQAPNTDWTDLNMGTLSAPNPGYLLITCTLPRQSGSFPSGIASYRIDE